MEQRNIRMTQAYPFLCCVECTGYPKTECIRKAREGKSVTEQYAMAICNTILKSLGQEERIIISLQNQKSMRGGTTTTYDMIITSDTMQLSKQKIMLHGDYCIQCQVTAFAQKVVEQLENQGYECMFSDNSIGISKLANS